MRLLRWFLFALGFVLGSVAGGAVRGSAPVDDLILLPPPVISEDPRVLSGWVGSGSYVQLAPNHPAPHGPSGYCDGADDGCDELSRGWASDHDFDCMISPMTNPVYFEDPRTLTELRFLVLHQNLPLRGTLAGGDFQFLGVQARAALSERLSVVMAKSGFFAAGAPTPIDDGWSDVAIGLKYNLYRDVESQRLLSGGFHYELPVGSPSALQGNGDGEYHLYLTGSTAVFDYSHFQSAFGLRLPGDTDAESRMLYWSNHWDTRIWSGGLYAVAEANWFQYFDGGNAQPLDIEGLDLFNFGSSAVTGNDILTGAAGLKMKPSAHQEIGVAYEFPLTDRRDILEDRWVVDLIFRY